MEYQPIRAFLNSTLFLVIILRGSLNYFTLWDLCELLSVCMCVCLSLSLSLFLSVYVNRLRRSKQNHKWRLRLYGLCADSGDQRPTTDDDRLLHKRECLFLNPSAPVLCHCHYHCYYYYHYHYHYHPMKRSLFSPILFKAVLYAITKANESDSIRSFAFVLSSLTIVVVRVISDSNKHTYFALSSLSALSFSLPKLAR